METVKIKVVDTRSGKSQEREVPGIVVGGYKGLTLIAHKSVENSSEVSVSDAGTGWRIAKGPTHSEAVERAIDILDHTPEQAIRKALATAA